MGRTPSRIGITIFENRTNRSLSRRETLEQSIRPFRIGSASLWRILKLNTMQCQRIDLPSQIDFSFLSVPESWHVAQAHDYMDHDTLYDSGSSISRKAAIQEQDVYVPVNYICPEAYALLATFNYQACDSERMDVDSCSPASTSTSMAPPKRFFRTFWRSISLRLLDHSAQRAHEFS